jgi:hypothetical protein
MLRATASPEGLARDCWLNSEWRAAEAQVASSSEGKAIGGEARPRSCAGKAVTNKRTANNGKKRKQRPPSSRIGDFPILFWCPAPQQSTTSPLRYVWVERRRIRAEAKGERIDGTIWIGENGAIEGLTQPGQAQGNRHVGR